MIPVFLLMISAAVLFLCRPLLKDKTKFRRVNFIWACAVMLLVPIGSLMLYLYLGSPELVK
jgi:hypothetical protein